ncbi:Fur-regulated basic protein FbpA [Bacillus spongiae]|uniref:Fur-regulated basic protein FbpA n=1 Tax=Bacillus spongiae TaxID=2683610 RepID=A0ABU8HGC0_9BACI
MNQELAVLDKDELIDLFIQKGIFKAEDGRHLFQLSLSELYNLYQKGCTK